MYAWVKVVHILAVISWMAGLFYLPRLFVYHADRPLDGEADQTFLVMERRLLKAIMRPAAIVVILSGLALIHLLSLWPLQAWLILKLGAVGLMILFHGLLEFHAGEFRKGLRVRGARYFRVINEVPTVLLISIVIFVVIRPFS